MATEDRGFASMDPQKQRAIASKGGKASHSSGRSSSSRTSSSRARSGGTRGGSSAQHANAGRQSHKND